MHVGMIYAAFPVTGHASLDAIATSLPSFVATIDSLSLLCSLSGLTTSIRCVSLRMTTFY